MDQPIESYNPGGFLSDKQYNFVKFLTVIVLPAIGTLYFTLAELWGLPSAAQVLGTILAVEAFIGAVLGISTRQYEKSGAKYAGEINVSETPEKTNFNLELKDDPMVLKEKEEVTFKVNPS